MALPLQISGSGDTVPWDVINANSDALGSAFEYALDREESGGLDLAISGGQLSAAITSADTEVSCTDDDDNYIVVHRTTGVITGAIDTTNWDNTTTYGRIGIATFASGVRTNWDDARRWPGGVFMSAGSGSPVTSVNGATGAVSITAAGISAQGIDATLTALAGLATGANKIPYSTGTDTFGQLDLDTDVTLAANSDARLATQKAVKAYVDAIVTGGATDLLQFKGVVNASANPNYLAADAGHTYVISVAGKIGGASGVDVEAGDLALCIVDATSAGDQAAVGANWTIIQRNLVSAYVAGGTDVAVADGGTGASTAAGARANLGVGQTVLAVAGSDETTALTTGTGKVTFINPFATAFNVVAVVASLTTAQASGSIFTVDINEAGSTILSTKLTIDNTEKNSSSAATPAVISDASIAAYAEITVDIDQIGDGTATGLKVYIIGYPS